MSPFPRTHTTPHRWSRLDRIVSCCAFTPLGPPGGLKATFCAVRNRNDQGSCRVTIQSRKLSSPITNPNIHTRHGHFNGYRDESILAIGIRGRFKIDLNIPIGLTWNVSPIIIINDIQHVHTRFD